MLAWNGPSKHLPEGCTEVSSMSHMSISDVKVTSYDDVVVGRTTSLDL